MRHLNYNHLLYFWTVAREGSIARASETLNLTPQTISGQLKTLEEVLGRSLFERVGRKLTLSATGQIVNQYAEEIFTLGAELTQRMKSERPGTPTILNVGIVDSIAKLIAYRILEPVLNSTPPVRIVCVEGDLEGLLGDLAVHKLDLVLSDRALPTGLNVKAYNHLLGDSGVGFFAASGAQQYRQDFPHSLNRAPLLLPVNSSALRRRLNDWFDMHGISPQVVAEFDDSALMKAFGEAGAGVFAAPLVIAENIERMYGTKLIGEALDVKETYYAISPERKIKHPAVQDITQSAKLSLFAGTPR